jgi:hypothetical protein
MEQQKNKDSTIAGAIIGGLFAVIAACISLIPSFREELFGNKQTPRSSTDTAQGVKPTSSRAGSSEQANSTRKVSLSAQEIVEQKNLAYSILYDDPNGKESIVHITVAINNPKPSPIHIVFDDEMVEVVDIHGIPTKSFSVTTVDDYPIVPIAGRDAFVRRGVSTRFGAYVKMDKSAYELRKGIWIYGVEVYPYIR